jgi:hypothetical protein
VPRTRDDRVEFLFRVGIEQIEIAERAQAFVFIRERHQPPVTGERLVKG